MHHEVYFILAVHHNPNSTLVITKKLHLSQLGTLDFMKNKELGEERHKMLKAFYAETNQSSTPSLTASESFFHPSFGNSSTKRATNYLSY